MIGLRDVLVVAPAASFHPQHHHHHHHHADAAAPLLSPADHPIIPLLTAAPCGIQEDPDRAGRLNLWQNQPTPPPAAWGNLQQSPFPGPGSGAGPSSYLCKPMPVPVLDSASATSSMGGLLGGGGGGGKGLMAMGVVAGVGDGLSSPFTTCQDCGNKAKKDCVHRRCRTCCKSRGFDCSTHLKSTWVPAAHRRERQVSSSAPAAAGPAGMGSSASTSGAKKPRLVSSNDQTATTNTTSTSNTTPPRSFDTSSSHQDAEFRQSLPGQVTAPAVFKCVRVTTVDDGEDEYAYQAVVNIGGHIFKGFLYDQGVSGDQGDATAHTSSPGGGGDHRYNTVDGGGRGNNATGTANRSRPSTIPNISELHLGGGGGGVPSDVFGAALGGGGGGLIGGTAFGNPID